MKIITVFNQKGGVGKTTTNINLCSYLANKGYKILTIDVDPQGNTTSGLGVNKDLIKYSTYDVMTSDISINDAIINIELIDNLYIIPSTIELVGAEVELVDNKNREHILKNKLRDLNDDFDYVFIDCPPSLGILTINALVSTDSVIIPIQCEFYALEGVSQLINTINLVKQSLNKNIKIEGIVMSMYDGRTKLSSDVVNEVKKYFNSKVYNTMIPRNIRLAEAPSFGLPIMLYDDKCKGALAYEELTQEFLDDNKVK